jgi:MoaA/NifB/PqqE/SkfB family radical SAM enzyme/SAM-dependent methyltransferase
MMARASRGRQRAPVDARRARADNPDAMPARRRVIIKVGYACNNYCSFCHTWKLRQAVPDATTPRLLRRITRASGHGYDEVVFSGGEVTLRRDLPLLGAQAARRGMTFGLITNGRVLAYEDYLDELAGLGLRYVYMSLHGPDAATHDHIVGDAAFVQTLDAVRNLARRPHIETTVNCVVVKQNVDRLRDVVDLLMDVGGAFEIKFGCLETKGAADKAFRGITPPLAEAAAAVAAALRHGLARRGDAPWPRFGHEGFPLCLLPGLEALDDDMRAHRIHAMAEADEDDFFPIDDMNRAHGGACADCTRIARCAGPYRLYLERRGDGELMPARREGPRGNAFVYRRLATHPDPGASAPCALAGAALAADRPMARLLYVREGREVALHVTDTADFGDQEVMNTREDGRQVYLDARTHAGPITDFRRDLRPVALEGPCRACPARPVRCPGRFAPHDADVFGAADAPLGALVAALRGRVLDVGSGPLRYEPLVRQAAARGDLVAYHTLDPHVAPADAPLRDLPGAAHFAIDAESFAPDGVRYDTVLVLRAWNHLRDPAAALTRIGAALAPGGRIIVADNVAYGIVSSRAGAPGDAGAGEGPFEHWRNDSSWDALARLAVQPGLDLTTVEHHPVEPGRGNQWWLVLTNA